MNRVFTVVLIIFCGLLISGYAMAEFYEWVDENGVTHISDSPVAQETQKIKYKKLGENDNEDYNRWINCSTALRKAEIKARALLKENEKWSALDDKDIIARFGTSSRNGDVLTYDNSFMMSYDVSPKQRVAQRWTVQIKTHPKDKNSCSIMTVDLK